jgi:hypothetical protein
MRKFSIFLLLLVFAGMTFAQAPVKQLTEREKLILKINRELEYDTVIEVLRKYNNDILKSVKDNKPLIALQYYSFAAAIDNRFVKYRWFIADTGLSKKWLKDVQELFAYMSKTQSYIEAAKINGQTQTAKYKKAVEYFNTAQMRLAKLIKKPVRVSGRVLRKAKQQKTMWQKAMRKKYKIKEKF